MVNRQTNYNQQMNNNLSLAGGQSQNSQQDRRKMLEDNYDVYVTSNTHGKSVDSKDRMIVIISGFFSWLASIVWVFVCIMNIRAGQTNLSALDSNFMISLIVMILCCIVFTLDALILNRTYKKNIFLFVISWVLNFLYISRRTLFLKYKRSIFAVMMSVIMFLSTVGLGYTLYCYLNEYSVLMSIENDEEKEIIREFLNTENGDGLTYAQKFSEECKIRSMAENTTQTGEQIIVVLASGKYDAIPAALVNGEKNTSATSFFVDKGSKSVTTQLRFVKSSTGTSYQLNSVVLNDKPLKYRYVFNYWDLIIK